MTSTVPAGWHRQTPLPARPGGDAVSPSAARFDNAGTGNQCCAMPGERHRRRRARSRGPRSPPLAGRLAPLRLRPRCRLELGRSGHRVRSRPDRVRQRRQARAAHAQRHRGQRFPRNGSSPATDPGPHHLTFKVPDLARPSSRRAVPATSPSASISPIPSGWRRSSIRSRPPASSSSWPRPPPRGPVPAPDDFPVGRRVRADGTGPVRSASLRWVTHAVAELETAIPLFVDLLGGEVVGEGALPDLRWRELTWGGPMGLRLVTPTGTADTPLRQWLGSRSGRVHHLEFSAEEPGGIAGAVPGDGSPLDSADDPASYTWCGRAARGERRDGARSIRGRVTRDGAADIGANQGGGFRSIADRSPGTGSLTPVANPTAAELRKSARAAKWAVDRLDGRERRFSFIAAGAAVLFGLSIYFSETHDKHFRLAKGQLTPQTTLLLGHRVRCPAPRGHLPRPSGSGRLRGPVHLLDLRDLDPSPRASLPGPGWLAALPLVQGPEGSHGQTAGRPGRGARPRPRPEPEHGRRRPSRTLGGFRARRDRPRPRPTSATPPSAHRRRRPSPRAGSARRPRPPIESRRPTDRPAASAR